ncbi:MAG: hypothetical protein Q4E51_02885 [Lachnospiraceae bacterium]|nr:hypothetical protein [Lachnospiraceae bacterium]
MISKRQNIGNIILMIAVLAITTLEWHFSTWYALFTPYGTLITFVALVAATLCYVDIKDMVKDPVFWLIAGTSAVALMNLFIIKSNKGCILVTLDMGIVLYLANKVRLTKKQTLITLCYMAFFFFYWTVDVKGYFKGYNTNYGGLILITGFACLMIISEYITKYLREHPSKYNKLYILVELFFIALAYNIIAWYRSRTALIGLITLLLIKFTPVKIITNKVVYTLISIFGTIGGVITSLVYIGFGHLKGVIDIQLFYKDLVSGREVLWEELWQEFIKSPLTGIGSSYVVKTDFMEGMLEVHGGFLDILIVHGIIVFIPLFMLFTKRLLDKRNIVSDNKINKAVFAAIICMLITSFFENFIIVQPFTLVILLLFAQLNVEEEG